MNIEKKYYYVTPFNELKTIKDKQLKLNASASDIVLANMTPFQAETFRAHNGNNPYDGMSAYERKQEAARLNAVKAGIIPKVVSAFKNDWAAVKQEYQTLKREQIGAADRSAKNWDYGRLAYEKQQARDFLSRATLDAIGKKYKEAEIVGDRHTLRALAETGVEILQERHFTDKDVIRATDLRKDFEKMSDDLVITKEQQDLLKQSSILSGKIGDLYDKTRDVQSEFSSSFEPPKDENGHYMFGQGQPDPFSQMTKGVTVSRKVDPANLATITEIDIRGEGWDSPE